MGRSQFVGLRVQRIVNLDARTQPVTEIPSALLFGRHASEHGAPEFTSSTLVVAENERLILPDRTAQRAAKLVPERVGYKLIRAGKRLRLSEGITRLSEIIAPKFEGAAVKFVRS